MMTWLPRCRICTNPKRSSAEMFVSGQVRRLSHVTPQTSSPMIGHLQWETPQGTTWSLLSGFQSPHPRIDLAHRPHFRALGNPNVVFAMQNRGKCLRSHSKSPLQSYELQQCRAIVPLISDSKFTKRRIHVRVVAAPASVYNLKMDCEDPGSRSGRVATAAESRERRRPMEVASTDPSIRVVENWNAADLRVRGSRWRARNFRRRHARHADRKAGTG